MPPLFRVLNRRPTRGNIENTISLVRDNWDDFGFKTSFDAYCSDQSGGLLSLGLLKIGQSGQTHGYTPLPQEFDELGSDYFSLGQEDDYYERLHSVDEELRNHIVNGLHDLVRHPDLYEGVKEEPVLQTSLLRGLSESTLKGTFARLLQGASRLSPYVIKYEDRSDVEYTFDVIPESQPPSNVHVLIGRNGVGKTTLLRRMAESLMGSSASSDNLSEPGSFVLDETAGTEQFAGVVSISFSAFDGFFPPSSWTDASTQPRYAYIGLRKESATGTRVMDDWEIDERFATTILNLTPPRRELWLRALRHLEGDPIFEEFELSDLSSREAQSQIQQNFHSLSSGHKIVLLTITRLAVEVEEKTLVLIDEPEAHLHPPLLSALIRSLSDMLTFRNGVAIVATHSPVVLQEVPASCVWVITRFGDIIHLNRPKLETFGENVGVLTHEVFGLEVTTSGFYTVLSDLAKSREYTEVLAALASKLGSEGRSLLRGMTMESGER